MDSNILLFEDTKSFVDFLKLEYDFIWYACENVCVDKLLSVVDGFGIEVENPLVFNELEGFALLLFDEVFESYVREFLSLDAVILAPEDFWLPVFVSEFGKVLDSEHWDTIDDFNVFLREECF